MTDPEDRQHPLAGGPVDTDGAADATERSWGSKIVWGIACLAVLALGVGGFLLASSGQEEGSAPETRPPLISVAGAEPADALTIRQTGFVQPLAIVDITSIAAGRIETLGDDFRVGARLAEGETVVALEGGTLRAELDRATAEAASAEASLAEARLEQDRQEQLEARDFASEARLQDAIVGVARAEAQVAAARASRTLAQDRLDDTRVAAPFDGIVVSRDASPGQLVQPGAAVGRLVASEAVEVEMGLTPRDRERLSSLGDAVGAQVRLFGTGPARQPLGTGLVTAAGVQVSEATRTVALVVRVEDPFDPNRPGRPLRMGELVELELSVPLDNLAAVAVPVLAVKDGRRVWAVRDGTLRAVPVTVLERGEAAAIVLGDLTVGARVMTSDLPAALDGQAVRVRTDEAVGDEGA